MKKISAAFFIIFALASFNFAQSSKILANTAPPDEKVVPVEINDPVNDFSTKGLPEPFIIGDRRSDETAAKVAREISKYDERAFPILLAALQKAGFFIMDENQKILFQPTAEKKGMGLAFYDFEVAGMYKLSRVGVVTSIGKLSDMIGKELTPEQRRKFGELMLEDLRAAANLPPDTKPNQAKRFWARLIVELGRQFPKPVDLMTATPETAQINIIQASLWQRRLVGDLIGFVGKQSAISFQKQPSAAHFLRPVRNDFRFVNAAFSQNFGALEPCNYANEETVEMDATANVVTTIHGKILDVFAEQVETLAKIGKGIGIANLALSWAKLVAAYTQMQGAIKIQEPLPLIRTKSNTSYGERRLLTGKFEIKINNLRVLNCFRITINMTTGLDFSMPSSGPLAQKPVAWELGGEVSFYGQGSSQTGKYDQVVYFKAEDGANADYHKQETDENGESKIYLEGNKQKRDLVGEKVVPLPKKAVIRADVALKNMKDTGQEATDIGGFILGTGVGGINPLGILSAVPEIGFRLKVPVTAISVPIRDWTPCSEDWGGTIEVRRVKEETTVLKSSRQSNGNMTGNGIRRVSDDDKIIFTLNPRKPDEMQTVDPKPALIEMTGKHSDISDLIREGDPCCYREQGIWNTKFREGREMRYSAITRHRAFVGFNSNGRDFSLSFDLDTGRIPVTWRYFREINETNCLIDEKEAYSKESDMEFFLAAQLLAGRYGNRFVNSEGEILQGSKKVDNPDNSTTVYTWNLARCKNQ